LARLFPRRARYARWATKAPARTKLLKRRATGDWGDLSEDDRRENALSVAENFRILSAYTLPRTGVKVWVITEADRSATTLLLPDEY